MSRRGFGSADDGDDELNVDISPMIDCVFILLIFFIVTTVFIEETGVKVNKPEASTATALDKNSILIAVTAENQVFYGGKNIGMAGIRAAVKPIIAEKKDTPVNVQGDINATHGTTMQVYDIVRAAVREAGGDENTIAFSTKNQ